MQFIRGLHNLRLPVTNGYIATIGNYDGLHLGHQSVINTLTSLAKKNNLPSLAIIFEPQPREFFTSNSSNRISTLREKLCLLNYYGVNVVLLLNFNHFLASQSAQEFITNVLAMKLNIKHLVVGDDFAFGQGRQGDFNLLKKYTDDLGIALTQMDTFKINGTRVSSSLIREHMTMADGMDQISTLLGHSYGVIGKVVHGNHFGRTLGFPTANIYLRDRRLPFRGVYLVGVSGIAKKYYGIANFGVRPTFASHAPPSLEVHLLNFQGNLYGKYLLVEFYKKIRDEKCFTSKEALVQQIRNDKKIAKTLLPSY